MGLLWVQAVWQHKYLESCWGIHLRAAGTSSVSQVLTLPFWS